MLKMQNMTVNEPHNILLLHYVSLYFHI